MATHNVARTEKPRTEDQRKQDLRKIEQYRSLEDRIRNKAEQNLFDQDTFQDTSKLLRQNPEYYTVWNVRRRCLIYGLLSKQSAGLSPSMALPSSSANDTPTTYSDDLLPSSSTPTQQSPDSLTAGTNGTTVEVDGEVQNIDQEVLRHELDFTIPLLIQFPKCYWIWNYRIWILQQVTDRLETLVARKIWEEELGLVSKMLERDRRNFHAWTYRRHVVTNLESKSLGGQSLVEPEFAYTTRMITSDLSNFSAWHNRSKLIPRLLDQRGSDQTERKKFLETELKTAAEGLNVDPEDQSLWYYHQFLISNIAENQNVLSFVPGLTNAERANYIYQEIDDIKDLLEDYQEVKWIYEMLIEYAVAVAKIEDRKLNEQEEKSIHAWLNKLKELDPRRVADE